MVLSRVNWLTISDMFRSKERLGAKKKKKSVVWRGGTQQSDHRTCLRKASADGADTASCLSSFHSLMVRGKNEFCLMSFLHWSRRSCWSCALLDLVGAGSSSLHCTLILWLLILYRFVSLVAFLLFSSDGHLRLFSMLVTLLVCLWSFSTNLAALLWIFSILLSEFL